MIIGFTGHQRVDDPDRWGWVQEQFSRILQEVAKPGDRAMTSLAKGGDQLFSSVALTRGIAIDVIVPCTDYETTFNEPGDLAQYESLLTQATNVIVLDFPGPSQEAFLAAGIHVVKHSGLLVTLWNGKAAIGKGGTGDIVAYAREQRLPVIHIHPDHMQVFGLSPEGPEEMR